MRQSLETNIFYLIRIIIFAAVIFLISACDIFSLNEPRERINPYDNDLSYVLEQDIYYEVSAYDQFIYPTKIAVSDDNRFLAVISESQRYLNVYDTENGYAPIEIPEYEHENVIDIAFGSGSVLYALTDYSLTRIDCNAATFEVKFADSVSPRMNARFLSVDSSTGTDELFLYGNNDDWQTRSVFRFQSFVQYPNDYMEYCTELFTDDVLDNDIEFSDFTVADACVYFTGFGSGVECAVLRWDIQTDTFVEMLYYDGVQMATTSDTSVVPDSAFRPFSLDSANGYLYFFANGPGNDAIYRLTIPSPAEKIDVSALNVWASQMNDEFQDVDYFGAYELAADPSSIDRVYLAEIIKWENIKRITLRDINNAAPLEIIEGREFENDELVETSDFVYHNNSLYFLDNVRGVVMCTSSYGVWTANYGDGVLSPYELESLSVGQNGFFVADHDYSTDHDVIREFEADGTFLGNLISMPRGDGEILSVLAAADGRILLWYHEFGTNENTIRLYSDEGVYISSCYISLQDDVSLVRSPQMTQDASGRIYAAYTYYDSGYFSSQDIEHTAIELISLGASPSSTLVFSTANSSQFSYDYSSWSMYNGNFGFRDIAVTPDGFVWVTLEQGIIFRLYPLDTFSDGTLHFQGCLHEYEGGVLYTNRQPLEYVNNIGGVHNIAAIDALHFATVDRYSGHLRFFGRAN